MPELLICTAFLIEVGSALLLGRVLRLNGWRYVLGTAGMISLAFLGGILFTFGQLWR